MTLKKLQKLLHEKISPYIEARTRPGVLELTGAVSSHAQWIQAGKLAAKAKLGGVVNRVRYPGDEPADTVPTRTDSAIDGVCPDVLVIGGGVIGCALARELSRWKLNILLVEKESDVAMHASSRNAGMVHPGWEPKPGTLKARYNVRGNELYESLCRDIRVPFTRCGSLIFYDRPLSALMIPFVFWQARRNHVKGLKLLSKKEARALEPAVSEKIRGAIYVPRTAIISPYKTTVALMENAVQNTVRLSLQTAVTGIHFKNGQIVSVETTRGVVYPKVVLNAAGVMADKIADMAGDRFYTLHPRRGQICILDKEKTYTKHVVALPVVKLNSLSKGGGIIPTVDGNLLIGPDATESEQREDYATDREHINAVLERHLPLIPGLSKRDVITSFAGERPATFEEDFICERGRNTRNLVHIAGIQSPGLASAPAIAEDMAALTISILRETGEVVKRADFQPVRCASPRLNELPPEERARLIAERPAYGDIVCRCEEISRGEIEDALRGSVPVLTVDGIKRRVRAGMGRCQGGFCLPRLLEMLENAEALKRGPDSPIVLGEVGHD